MSTVDRAGLDALRTRYADRIRRASADSRYKYLDVSFYTLQKLLLAYDLGLDEGPPRRVLDIGTGAGHFLFVCRFLGHHAVGIDIENALYDGIAGCLGVERTIVRVEPHTPLPDLGGRFDLITACNVTFNDKRNPRGSRLYWSVEEWQFFLDDVVAHHLQRPGTLFIALTKERQGRLMGIDRLGYNRHVLSAAARGGATVSRRLGTIKLSLAGPGSPAPQTSEGAS
ncbi:MAG: class I SAM-dependent methyltransferase [Reyranella sp.]|uniref:class I SAM-dependent methyltransferase n=1 Tax=Reyranella sp. TaxID=1929291 RepID=UPI003D14F120